MSGSVYYYDRILRLERIAMRKAKVKNKLRGKVLRMLNEQQKKISRGVHKYSVQQKQEKNHREAK
jgi:hypothetical protein